MAAGCDIARSNDDVGVSTRHGIFQTRACFGAGGTDERKKREHFWSGISLCICYIYGHLWRINDEDQLSYFSKLRTPPEKPSTALRAVSLPGSVDKTIKKSAPASLGAAGLRTRALSKFGFSIQFPVCAERRNLYANFSNYICSGMREVKESAVGS